MKRRTLVAVTVMCVAVLGAVSVSQACETCGCNAPAAKKAVIKVCGSCGELKGTEKCCVAEAKKCTKCELNKGSPGCCKLPAKGTDAELCAKCGQIKGTDKCCKPGARKCTKCGMAKKSPGCCL